MVVDMNTFFKVVVLKVDLFGSDIVDERHFSDNKEASAFMTLSRSRGFTPVLVQM